VGRENFASFYTFTVIPSSHLGVSKYFRGNIFKKLEATFPSTVWHLPTKLHGAISQQTIFEPFMAMIT
jgi:hypothetical protein